MEKILILDTETTNSLDDALVYDVGFIVADYNGKVYSKHSFVVADVFLDEELMSVAYFADKIPMYWKEIKEGKRTLTSFNNIKWTLRHIMKENHISKVYAYNCRFDYMALATTQRYITSSKWRYVFPFGTEFHDILKLSRSVLKNCEDYHKFCEMNNFLTQYGKDRHTAEIVYKFFFDENFEEKHCGIEDAEIEYQIFLKLAQLDGFNSETKMW